MALEAVDFPGRNTIFAEDQPEYKNLPALSIEGQVITCWELTDEDILDIMKTKKVWVSQMTFGQPLQPIMVGIDQNEFFRFAEPIIEKEENS